MPSNPHPNILWIQTDEQRTDSLGCYGNPRLHTPHLDRLAAQGTLFLNHHVQSPVCVASRVCELTGHYPHQTGILENSVQYNWGTWPAGMPAFPELFAAAGYVTASFGKYHTPHHATWLENWHFEFFADEANYFGLAPAYDEAGHQVIHLGQRPGGVILSGCYPAVQGGRTPQSHLVDAVLDWLAVHAHVRRPFLLRASFLAPHTPVLAPEPFYSLYDEQSMDWDVPSEDLLANLPVYERGALPAYRAHSLADFRRMRCSYYGLVSHIDDQVGRLLGELEALGLRENTIVVFSSDHGDLMGEYGQFQKGMFYDLTTRVPFILAGSGIPAGQRVDRLTASIDLGPTLLRLAGLAPLEETEGRDVFHDPPRAEIIGEFLRVGAGLRRSWIRTLRWSLDFNSEIRGEETRKPEEWDAKLIDLETDPLQHHNLAHEPEYREVLEDLLTRFVQLTTRGRQPVQTGHRPG